MIAQAQLSWLIVVSGLYIEAPKGKQHHIVMVSKGTLYPTPIPKGNFFTQL